MTHDSYSDVHIHDILTTTRTIALVGASANPERPSHRVMGFLLRKGYVVHPVNPGLAGQVLQGCRVHGRLADIEEPIDMVDVFRAADALPALVDEILMLDPLPKVIWGQLSVRNDKAAEKAGAHGITVIMDRCPAIEYPRLIG